MMDENPPNGPDLVIQTVYVDVCVCVLFALRQRCVFAIHICPRKYLQNIMLEVIPRWRLVKWNDIEIDMKLHNYCCPN